MRDAPFISYCLELLASAGKPRARRMFGGQGIYLDDLFIALVAGRRLYLKADPTTRALFEQAGCEAFGYQAADGRKLVMSYWSAPAEAMDSPAQMLPWARLALQSALRAHAAKAAAAKPRAGAAAPKAPTKAAPKAPAKPAPKPPTRSARKAKPRKA